MTLRWLRLVSVAITGPRFIGSRSPQWIGIVKFDAQGKPIAGDVEETHGKEVVRSCDEVKELRAAAAAKQKK